MSRYRRHGTSLTSRNVDPPRRLRHPSPPRLRTPGIQPYADAGPFSKVSTRLQRRRPRGQGAQQPAVGRVGSGGVGVQREEGREVEGEEAVGGIEDGRVRHRRLCGRGWFVADDGVGVVVGVGRRCFGAPLRRDVFDFRHRTDLLGTGCIMVPD
jgi:hypothetical protein